MTLLLKDILQADKSLKKLNAVLLWEDVVDKKIKKHTKAIKLQKNVLYVSVQNSIWAQELGFYKTDFIFKINQRAGEQLVKDIRFKVGGAEE